MLQLKKICRYFNAGANQTKALDNVSISFRDKEFVSVLGPSGSGKTTMLNVIGGLDSYTSGDLLINGQSTKHFKASDWDGYRNNEVGFVFQSYNLILHQSVLANVELALTLSGIGHKERKERAIKALERVGLKDHINKKPTQLSGGQMQRVSIARALVNDPSIIFADEPTGALDTKTSVDIMELLKGISADKLVVMVTHNPELAKQYSTRIVTLKDGHIIADDKPFDPQKEQAKQVITQSDNVDTAKEADTNKKMKKQKTSMSFITALSLSLSNLLGKKGRTLVTAFAGSIGIIGIALIMAISNGVNLHTADEYKEDMTPITIDRTKDNTESIFSNITSQKDANQDTIDNVESTQQVNVTNTLTKKMAPKGYNDLGAFINYIEQNQDVMKDSLSSYEATYSAKPEIYIPNSEAVKEIYPENYIFSNMSSGSKIETSTSLSGTSLQVSLLGQLSSTNIVNTLSKDDNIYRDRGEIVGGHWPENNNECVLVLDADGAIDDTISCTLGLTDASSYLKAIEDYEAGRNIDYPSEISPVNFDQVLGTSFKVINSSQKYQYNSSTGLWEDNSNDLEYMQNVVNSGSDLKIVGIVMPSPEKSTVYNFSNSGIYIPYQVTIDCIKAANESEIVKAQQADPAKDVLTGKTFEDEKIAVSSVKDKTSSAADALSSLFNVDTNALGSSLTEGSGAAGSGNALASAFSSAFDPAGLYISPDEITTYIAQSLNEDTLNKIVQLITENKQFDKDLQEIIGKAANKYNEYYIEYTEKGLTPESAKAYFSEGHAGYNYIQDALKTAGKDLAPDIISALSDFTAQVSIQIYSKLYETVATKLASASTQIADAMTSAMSIDLSGLQSVGSFDFSGSNLSSLASTVASGLGNTYESNLKQFGYSNLEDPQSLTLYANSAKSKNEIKDFINSYNTEMNESGQQSKEISYQDLTEQTAKLTETIMNTISGVLTGFTAISLVVSSIMIGIITYISVLERRKEIGILRAIGARKRDIFNVFNAETFIVGLIAGIMGVVLTFLLCFPINLIVRYAFHQDYNIAVMPFGSALILIVISIGLTVIAGLLPSTSASKKDPVEAMNS